jgi:hypothetical protein
MSKSKSPVHETAASALSAWRELDAASTTARVEFQARLSAHRKTITSITEPPSDAQYANLIREAAIVDREAETERAAFEASSALDVALLAEGDADALARDPETLRKDLLAFAEEEQEIMNRQRDLTNRRDARLTAAVAADASIALRRRTEKSPFFAVLPSADHRPFPIALPYVEVLRNHIAHPPVQPTGAPYAATLRARAKQVAALLEDRRLAKEAAEKAEAIKAAHQARLAKEENRQSARKAAEANAIRAEFIQRHNELAAAYAKRATS